MQVDVNKIEAVRKFVQEKYPGFPVPNASYLILMIPRTGSNLLASHLENIQFGHPIEAFHFNHKSLANTYDWHIDFSDPAAHLRQAIEFQTINGTFGMKLNWEQLSAFLETARKITTPSEISLTDKEIFEVFFPSAKFIYMKRLDKIKQAVSFSKGMQTGLWKEKAGEDQSYKQYVLPPVYDRLHIEGCLEKLISHDVSWENYLSRNEFEYLELWYEDLAKDYTKTVQKVYTYLGIESESVPAPALKKQANAKSLDWVERFKSETPWLKNETFSNALESGDFLTAFVTRSTALIQQKEQGRWHAMPATRLKPIRKLFSRVQRKFHRTFGAKK